jgi:IMP dehydrogenase/GMP reductase
MLRFGVPVAADNVSTKEVAFDLDEARIDTVKVGVGPGAACTTRE